MKEERSECKSHLEKKLVGHQKQKMFETKYKAKTL